MFITLISISLFSGIISGMGIGGGSIFILLVTMFNLFGQKEAQAYNLIIFIAIGISTTMLSFKEKNIDKKLLKKLFIPIMLGSLIGSFIIKYIDEEKLKNAFYIFIFLIGTYEVVISLKNIILKNKNKK
jgi:uncharacterized membrane protein YfcA